MATCCGCGEELTEDEVEEYGDLCFDCEMADEEEDDLEEGIEND